PPPLQMKPETVLPRQVVTPQATPSLANGRHWPEPSHSPSALHDPGKPGSGEQSLSGSVSAATGPQVPSTPLPFLAAVQASHPPVQELSQQTPSTQKPLVQSEPLAQGSAVQPACT